MSASRVEAHGCRAALLVFCASVVEPRKGCGSSVGRRLSGQMGRHGVKTYPTDRYRRPTFALLALVSAVLTACGGDSGNGTPEHLGAPITVAVSDASGTWQPGTTIQMTATVSNDLGNRGVSWGVSCATAPCGSTRTAWAHLSRSRTPARRHASCSVASRL